MALLTLVATASLAPIVGPAWGQNTLPSIQVPGNTILVRYADLNTSTPEGMSALNQRLDSATVAVCRFHHGRLQDPQIENNCRYVAKRGAIQQFERNEGQQFAQQQNGPEQMAALRVTAH